MAKKLSETIIINEELLKLHSGLSKNVDVDKVFPFCILAQNFYVEPILGTALLEELQYEIENDSLSDSNKALIIKVAPCLALYTQYLATRSLAYSVTEKSITKEKSENSEPVTEKELGELILDIKNRAEMAEQLLIKYLCRCQDSYPLWFPSADCNCDKYQTTEGSSKNTFHNLIYFPNKKNGCDCGCNNTYWIAKK